MPSLTTSINKLDKLSRKLDPRFEPLTPSKDEEAVFISACWPMVFSSELKEKLANVKFDSNQQY